MSRLVAAAFKIYPDAAEIVLPWSTPIGLPTRPVVVEIRHCQD